MLKVHSFDLSRLTIKNGIIRMAGRETGVIKQVLCGLEPCLYVFCFIPK